MPIKCDQYNQVCVITVTGDFDGDTAAVTRKSIDEQIDQKQIVDFIFDMEKCTFVDSAGLETLLGIKRRSEELFGQFKLASLDENCRKILELTRLSHQFQCHDDLPGALKTMR